MMAEQFTPGQVVRVRRTKRTYETSEPFKGLIGHVVYQTHWLVGVTFEHAGILGNVVFPFRRDQLEIVGD
jgi:hypothetical protein